MAWSVRKLTEEGKAMFGWQFDEIDMDSVRAVTDTTTGQITLAIKVGHETFARMESSGSVHHKTEFWTKTGVWFMFDDGYETYIYRKGDILE